MNNMVDTAGGTIALNLVAPFPPRNQPSRRLASLNTLKIVGHPIFLSLNFQCLLRTFLLLFNFLASHFLKRFLFTN